VRLVVTGGRVLTSRGWREGDVVIDAGRIVASRDRIRGNGIPRLDAAGLLVAPGLIDVQVNGGLGHDFTVDPSAVWTVGARLARSGVTAFVPTLVSPRASEIDAAIGVLGAGAPEGHAGAVPIGLHCEGPMLSPRRRGVHPARRLRPPSLGLIRGWTRERGVRLVTIAPELAGALAVARALARRGVVVAAGHSDATYEEARGAFRRGVSAGTHLFNAMSGLHHRAPGLVGALLEAVDVRAGIIADGVHVHPAALALAWRSKGGPAGLALVSDASPAAGGRGDGRGPVGAGVVARSEAGVIAGGLIALDRAVRNVVAYTGCAPADAVRAASESPAALLGERERGAIRSGAVGDLVLLDGRLRVAATVVAGRVVHDRDGRASAPVRTSSGVSPPRRRGRVRPR
jgi:N-acetylglucosamine-6-phosphate deacetylase